MKKYSLAQSGLDDPIGFDQERERFCLLSLIQSFPDDPILHTICFTLYLLKRKKKHINHLYAFRKEQYIKNHFHYHCHNHHHCYHHQ